MWKLLTKECWCPYASGFLLALLAVPVFFVLDHSFGHLRYYLTPSCDQGMLSQLAGQIEAMAVGKTKYFWMAILLAGVLCGVGLSMLLSGKIWAFFKAECFQTTLSRFIFGLIGGFVLMLGLRLGIGDSHAAWQLLAGATQLSVGTFILLITALMAAILATKLMGRD